ncbi:MAG: YicC/YloC family endoribonuclease [Micropepsaceae bacterium]
MPLSSMTGFAEGRGAQGNLRWRWEVRSVNGRNLDIRLRIPAGYEGLEAGARILASERFSRGSIQAALTVTAEEGGRGFRIDPEMLSEAVQVAKRVAEETGLPPARVDGLLALRGVVIQEDAAQLDDEERLARNAAMLASLADALDRMAIARADEGMKIEKMLLSQVDEIETRTAEGRKLAANQPQAFRDKMQAQLDELLGPGSKVPEERLAQEVALLATRADLREELDRLAAHCQEARNLLGAGGPTGRKLDFLAQEFNREANTLCAKSSDIALTREGLALKAVIDQFREQVQNVE